MSQGTIDRTLDRLKGEFAHPSLQSDLERARTLAHLLDASFNVGGFRFGLNGLIGLLPVAGDTISTVAGTYPIFVAWKHGLGKPVITRMAANLGIQWAIGLLPWVGDYAETVFKANLRNLAVLERAVGSRAVSRTT